MYYPVTQSFNFFNDPQKIIDFANSLEFFEGNNRWPGKRTDDIWNFDADLYQHISLKILSLFYPKGQVSYNYEAEASFQKITYDDVKMNKGMGWVHDDSMHKLTAIIYLTPNNTTSGTSIYTPKKTIGALKTPQIKYDYNEGLPIDENDYIMALNEHNNRFRKVSDFYSEFNSMICFDSNLYHGANFDLKPGEERLTYITFFKNISAPYYPIVESSTIL